MPDELSAPTHDPFRVRLDGAALVARGREKEIYARPGKPSQVVKVFRPEVMESHAASPRLKARLQRRLGIDPHKSMLRQYAAYLDAMRKAAALGRPPPLAQPRGMVLTDRGLGHLSQLIRDADGRVAPALLEIVRGPGLAPEHVAALTAFARDLYAFNIVATDLNARNVVWEGRNGRNRFVLVDGFGARNRLPLRRWFPALNARRLDSACAGLARAAGLDWDRAARRFALRDGAPG